MPVLVAGRNAGWVVTIRDRTELEALVRQLDSVESLSTALRAQEHEFSNRLHVLSVLLELGEVEEATRYSLRAAGRDGPGERGDPARTSAHRSVAALLLAKIDLVGGRARRRGATGPDSRLAAGADGDLPVVTVLGDLIDNAVDAVADDPASVGRHPRNERGRAGRAHGRRPRSLTVTDSGPASPASASTTSSSTATRPRSHGAPCGAESGSLSCTGS